MLLPLSHTKEIIYCLHFDVSSSSLFSRKIYIGKIIIFTRKYYMWFSRRILLMKNTDTVLENLSCIYNCTLEN